MLTEAPVVAVVMGCLGGANSNSALTVLATWGSPRSSKMWRGRHNWLWQKHRRKQTKTMEKGSTNGKWMEKLRSNHGNSKWNDKLNWRLNLGRGGKKAAESFRTWVQWLTTVERVQGSEVTFFPSTDTQHRRVVHRLLLVFRGTSRGTWPLPHGSGPENNTHVCEHGQEHQQALPELQPDRRTDGRTVGRTDTLTQDVKAQGRSQTGTGGWGGMKLVRSKQQRWSYSSWLTHVATGPYLGSQGHLNTGP